MNNQIIEVFNTIPIFSLVILIIPIIIQAINDWNVSYLEQKLMTNFQRIKIYISITMLVSLVGTIMISFYYFFISDSNEGFLVTEKLAGLPEMFETILILFILIFSSTLLLFIPFLFAMSVFLIEQKFYINQQDNSKEWYIVRRTVKNGLLLKNKKDEYKFVKEWDTKTFIKEKIASDAKRVKFLYGKTSRFWMIFSIIAMLFIINIFSNFYQNNQGLQLTIKILFGIFLFSSLILSVLQFQEYKNQLKNEEKSETNKKCSG